MIIILIINFLFDKYLNVYLSVELGVSFSIFNLCST